MKMPKGGNMKMPKGGKMKMPKGGKTGITKIMKKLNGDKKGMLIFNPKNDDQIKKMKRMQNHHFQSLAG